MGNTLGAPQFSTRVPMQFLCADSPSLSITGVNSLSNNPKMFYVQPGAVGKIDLGINGQTFFRGDGEYAPFAIQVQWDQLAYPDYQKLCNLRSYFITMVSYRGVGYYGKLLMDGPKSTIATADIVSSTGTFYVLSPSDYNGLVAGIAPVARLPVPTTLTPTVGGAGTGFIVASQSNTYWLTYSTIWGETTPQMLTQAVDAGAGNSVTLSWALPSSNFVNTANLYVGQTSNPSSSKLLCQVFSGDTQEFVDLVGFLGATINRQPPTVNTAYRGVWQNGLWISEVP